MPPAAGPTPVGKVTTPLGPQSGAKPLPQATVKMTQPLPQQGGATASLTKPAAGAAVAAVEEEEDYEYEESGLMPFAILVLILALVVLAIEVLTKMGIGS